MTVSAAAIMKFSEPIMSAVERHPTRLPRIPLVHIAP